MRWIVSPFFGEDCCLTTALTSILSRRERRQPVTRPGFSEICLSIPSGKLVSARHDVLLLLGGEGRDEVDRANLLW